VNASARQANQGWRPYGGSTALFTNVHRAHPLRSSLSFIPHTLCALH
jgi:hypothetical protein